MKKCLVLSLSVCVLASSAMAHEGNRFKTQALAEPANWELEPIVRSPAAAEERREGAAFDHAHEQQWMDSYHRSLEHVKLSKEDFALLEKAWRIRKDAKKGPPQGFAGLEEDLLALMGNNPDFEQIDRIRNAVIGQKAIPMRSAVPFENGSKVLFEAEAERQAAFETKAKVDLTANPSLRQKKARETAQAREKILPFLLRLSLEAPHLIKVWVQRIKYWDVPEDHRPKTLAHWVKSLAGVRARKLSALIPEIEAMIPAATPKPAERLDRQAA